MLKLHEFLLIKVGVSKEKSDINLSIEDIKTLMDLLTKAHGKLKYSVLSQLPLEIAIIEWSMQDQNGIASTIPNGGAQVAPPGRGSPRQDILTQLIEKVKLQNHSIAGVLRGCSLKNYDGKKFVIEAKFKFHKEKLDETKTKILLEKILQEIEGKKIGVSILLRG